MEVAFYLTAGALLMLALLAASMTISLKNQKLNAALLTVASLSGAAYQFFTLRYHAATDIQTAVDALRVQTAVLLWSGPLFCALVTSFISRKVMGVTLLILGPLALVLIAINAAAPYTIRFDTVLGLQPVDGLNGWWRLDGVTGPYGLLAHLAVDLPVLVVLLITAWHVRRSRPKLARSLAFAVVVLMASALWGVGVDFGLLPGIYVAGFAVTALVVVLVHGIVREYQIARDHAERAELALSRVALGVSKADGEAFFAEMVQSVSDLIGARYVMIGVINEEAEDPSVRVLAYSRDGRLAHDIASYTLEHTPCEEALRDVCHYPKGVRDRFPRDPLLRRFGIEGYVGFAIKGSDGASVGIFSLMHDKPLFLTNAQRHILSIFAARAGAELARLSSEARMRSMAYTDDLTGLPNRAAFFEELNCRTTSMGVGDQGLVALLNIDRFKLVNDELGHDVGDQILRIAGRRLANADLQVYCAKMGGDEFAFLTGGAGHLGSALGAPEAIEQAIRSVFAPAFLVGDRVISLECSLGIAAFKACGNVRDIMRHADLALQASKTEGPGQTRLFEDVMEAHVYERNLIERVIRRGLDDERFFLAYQPQIGAKGHVVGFEAVIRCPESKEGRVNIEDMVKIAEETGLIHRLGAWVMETAVRTHKELSKRWPGLRLSVNVSPWEFARDDYVENLLACLDRLGADYSLLTLELTESALLADIEQVAAKMRILRARGLRIAIDDFGTGYSSLSYLHHLPLDEIKIDRSFTAKLDAAEAEQSSRPMVASIMSIARHLDLETVAEGIESQRQIDCLKDMGCTVYQGYHFSRPLTDDALLGWLVDFHQTAAQ